MLPSELLIARTYKGTIKPVFSPLTGERLQMAKELLNTFSSFVGKKKGELSEVLELYEGLEYDHRFIRGLTTILERRCRFESVSKIDPIKARRSVFEEANRTLVIDEKRREEVLTSVASSLNVSVSELERSLWADYEEELILKDFITIKPEYLLKSYNLSLAQTMLFNAMNMNFAIGNNYQRIFGRLKYLGLMYSIEHDEKERYRVFVDGPLSLFKFTKRYGTSLAKLLPTIMTADSWEVDADIVRDVGGVPRVLKFHIDVKERDKFPELSGSGEEKFDSDVELNFFNGFNSSKTGWTLMREPEMMIAGPYVFIPDFIFEKGEIKCYMEIVGFWTEDYLKKKIGKLKAIEEDKMIIAVDESLACSSIRDIGGGKEIIFYRKKVPLKPILRFLRGIEEKHIESELNRLKSTKIKLEGGVLNVAEAARHYGVSRGAMKRLPLLNYKMMGDVIVSEDTVRLLSEMIEGCDNYADVVGLIESKGIPGKNAPLILEAIGYTVKWDGLNIEDAKVVKSKSKAED